MRKKYIDRLTLDLIETDNNLEGRNGKVDFLARRNDRVGKITERIGPVDGAQ